jgi:flagellar hook-associated protein 2
MATGSITTLGIGSGLDLQDILDQLKEADSATITAKETEATELQTLIDSYNSVNAQLFNIKSTALSLSLESDFLKTSVTVSDEDIASVTADDGISATSFDLEVTSKARYNSWQSTGVDSESAVIYTEPESGITDSSEAVTTESTTYDILYGASESQETISVTVDSGLTLGEIAQAINESDNNQDSNGDQLVTASVLKSDDGEYYIRLASAQGGDSVDEQVSLTGFDYIKTDTTISIARADNEDPMYLSLAPGTTYAETVQAINGAADNPGVTASIIDTGDSESAYRLTLTSDKTGEDYRISIGNLPLTEVNGADEDSLNAEFSINGVSYQRQSNDAITDVIAGVTINLEKVGETSVGIEQDTEEVKENILSLVEGFNELLSIVEGESDDSETDEEEETNPFENDYTMARMVSDLKNLITSFVDVSSEYKSLGDLGLEINRDGTLEIDEETLDQALAEDYDAVASLFLGDEDAEITGLGDKINDAITDLISSSGIVTTEIDEAETRLDKLEEDIETATERLENRYDTLTAQFVQLDTQIAQLNSESEYLQSIIDSFNSSSD